MPTIRNLSTERSRDDGQAIPVRHHALLPTVAGHEFAVVGHCSALRLKITKSDQFSDRDSFAGIFLYVVVDCDYHY